jgi:three-Cys-motif partner protein
MNEFEYDEIGYWTEIKLDIVKEYASAYTKIMHRQPNIKKYLYIDAFAGSGYHILKRTGGFVRGSPLNALNLAYPFHEYHFIDLDGDKVDSLRQQVGARQTVFFYKGDANALLIDKIFPHCSYNYYHRALCLLDPYALNVDWNVLQTAGRMGSIEIFYNFMIMDANMNVFLRNPDKLAPDQSARMDKVWGNSTWRTAVYDTRQTLFGDTMDIKASNEDIAERFRQRLETVAGFKYVPDPIPMRNKKGAVIYYLYFASPNEKGGKIVKDIFNKYRSKGIR